MISIIMPTYNRRNCIGRALKSIANQEFKDYEVIVVNDGGESVYDIVKNSGLNKFYYINNKNNIGLFPSLNIGITKSTGDLIAFLDDDDMYYPNALMDMLSGFKINCIMGVYANCVRIRNDLDGEKEIFPNYNMIESDPFKIIERNCMVSSARLLKRKAIIDLNKFDERFKIIGDHEFNIKFSIKYGFVYVDKVVCEITMHDKSLSCSGNENKMAKEYEIIKERYRHAN